MEIAAFTEKCGHLVAQLASCGGKYSYGEVSEGGLLQECRRMSQMLQLKFQSS